MPFYYSVLAAIIPMSLYLIIIWKLDRNEREPFKNVLKHFMWGAFGAIILGVIISYFFTSTAELFTNNESVLFFLGAVIIAPVVEEITKAIYLFKTFRSNYFDNITDGLVYGGAIGLGFGMTENLMYFISYDESFPQWASLVFTRSVFSAVMHAIASSTLGAFLAKAKFSLGGNKIWISFIGLFLAISFHLIWNLTLTFEFTYWIGFVFMIVLIITYFRIFKSSVNSEKQLIEAELSEELKLLNIYKIENLGFQSIVNSKHLFINMRAKRDFQNFGTKLAFRKFQARNSSGLQLDNYNSDIDLFRSKIKSIFERTNIT